MLTSPGQLSNKAFPVYTPACVLQVVNMNYLKQEAKNERMLGVLQRTDDPLCIPHQLI